MGYELYLNKPVILKIEKRKTNNHFVFVFPIKLKKRKNSRPTWQDRLSLKTLLCLWGLPAGRRQGSRLNQMLDSR